MVSAAVLPASFTPSASASTSITTTSKSTQTISNTDGKPIRRTRNSSSHNHGSSLQHWTSSKCLRILRPFTSKISALKVFVQSTPSAIAASLASSSLNPTTCIAVSDALSALVSSSAPGHCSSTVLKRTSGELNSSRGLVGEYRYGNRVDEEYRPDVGRRKGGQRVPLRTYSGGAGATSRTPSFIGSAEVGSACGNGKPGNDNGSSSLMHLTIQKENLNGHLFALYFAIYHSLAQIIQVTETKTERGVPSDSKPAVVSTGAPSLVTLATHSLAHCILATSPRENPNSTLPNYNQSFRHEDKIKQQEIPQSDWYDGVQEVSSTYLPSLLRFHAIEVVAQSIRTRGIDCNLGALLAGLCFEMEAVHEGEVIVRELLRMDEKRGITCIYLYLICCNKDRNPSFVGRGWRLLKEYIITRLPEVGVEVLGAVLGGVVNRPLRERAWKDWMFSGILEARDFVLETMRVAFGLWGPASRDDVRMRMCRMDSLRKKGIKVSSERGGNGISMKVVNKIRKLVYGNNALNKSPARKVGEVILEYLDVMGKTALGLDPKIGPTRAQEAKEVLWDLVEGFLEQSGEVKNVVEAVWGGGEFGGGRVRERGFYPKDSKILVLLFALVELGNHGQEGIIDVVSQEVSRVLEEERYAAIAALKGVIPTDTVTSTATEDPFIEKLVDHLIDFYTSAEINTELGHEGVRNQVKMLMQIAFPPAPNTSTAYECSTIIPTTPGPKTPATKKLTLTPASISLSPEDEATCTRYYFSKLALLLASRFSSLPETKYSEFWVKWVEDIEKKVLCMPIPTPARRPAHYRRCKRSQGEHGEKKETKARIGWKWEEGLRTWVPKTGVTPRKNNELGDGPLGGAVRRSARLSFSDEVEEGRRWVFGGVVLSPVAMKAMDNYELFCETGSEENEESEEDGDDGAQGLTETEENRYQVFPHGDEVENFDTMTPQSPLSLARKKKRSTAYVLPTSSSSLSSEGEGDSSQESSSINPCYLLPSLMRLRKSPRSSASYRRTNQFQLYRRQSTRAAAQAPKRYIDQSSSGEEVDGWSAREDNTMSMLSSPPPEEMSTHKREQLSLLDVLRINNSPIVKCTSRVGKKRNAGWLDTPAQERKLRKKARVVYTEQSDGEQVVVSESPSEADDEKDGDFIVRNARKRRMVSGTVCQATSNEGKMEGRESCKRREPVKRRHDGPGDVFLDGHKWDLRAKSANNANANGVYSSPPESILDDVDNGDVTGSDSEMEGSSPAGGRFSIATPIKSQASKKLARTKNQRSQETRLVQSLSISRMQKRVTRRVAADASKKPVLQMSLKQAWGTTKGESSSSRESKSYISPEEGSLGRGKQAGDTGECRLGNYNPLESEMMLTRSGRSVQVRSYVEPPDEDELSEDELWANNRYDPVTSIPEPPFGVKDQTVVMRIYNCFMCSHPIYPSKGIVFIRNDAKEFRFCRSKCHKNFKMKRNPRKLKWTKAFRKAAGKEMVVDTTLTFAARRNVPTRYSRELVAKTLNAMQRVEMVRRRRERVFYKNRMAGNKERQREADRKLVEENQHLLLPYERDMARKMGNVAKEFETMEVDSVENVQVSEDEVKEREMVKVKLRARRSNARPISDGMFID